MNLRGEQHIDGKRRGVAGFDFNPLREETGGRNDQMLTSGRYSRERESSFRVGRGLQGSTFDDDGGFRDWLERASLSE